MKRLWWRFLDWLWPRYVVGCDPASDDFDCTVKALMRRDGTIEIQSIEHRKGP